MSGERRIDAAPAAIRMRSTLVVLFVFGLFVACVVTFGTRNDRVAADQDQFHLPTIRQFAAQWPRPDLHDYQSATSPGYHLLLAAALHYAGDRVGLLRVVGGSFGFLLIGLLAWAASRRCAYLALPAAASVYVLSSTVWLLPENAAWALLTLALLLALRTKGPTLYFGSAVTLAALVFLRQTNIWAILPVTAVAAALCRKRCRTLGSPADDLSGVGVLPTHLSPESMRGQDAHTTTETIAVQPSGRPRSDRVYEFDWRPIAFAMIAVLPAIIVLASLVLTWHGLTPPMFQPNAATASPLATRVGGWAPAAPAMVLALLGVFGTPLIAWLWPAERLGRLGKRIAVGAVAGFVLGVLPVTSPSFERHSGLWNVADRLPHVADRSPLIVGLSTLGGVVATLALVRLHGRDRLVLAAALTGFTAMQLTNALLWQRYFEPFVLIWLTLAAGSPDAATNEWTPSPIARRLRIVGLIALVALQLAGTAVTLRQP